MEEKLGGILEKRCEAGLRKHLETCPTCAAEWKANRETRSLLRSWTVPEPPVRARARVMAAVQADPFTREERRFHGRNWGLVVVEFGAAALLAFLAFQLFFSGGTDITPAVDPNAGGQAQVYPENYMVDLMNNPEVSGMKENEKDMLLGTITAGRGDSKLLQEKP
jgi:hypothetical protein